MDPIRDLTWMKHLQAASAVERTSLGAWRLVALTLPHGDNRAPTQYLYRMLAFPPAGHKPVLALNLELSILGTACLTEQTGSRHVKHETVGQDMGYAEFRQWALARATAALGVTADAIP